MTSGKILATVVGVAAAAILITQLASNQSEEEPLVEHWNMNPTMGIISERSYTCAKTGKNVRARDLTSGLPDSVFFQPNQLQPGTVIGATNVVGNAVGSGAGMQTQYLQNANPTVSPQVAFSNFAQAAAFTGDSFEGYREDFNNRSTSAPPQHKCHSDDKVHSSSAGCGPAGTIANGYGLAQANALGHNFSPMETPSLPVSHSDAYSLNAGTLNTLDSAGNPQSYYMTDRLMYSTLKRARCPGTVDMIRGDLAIQNTGQIMTPAGTPADVLETGAFAALYGPFGTSTQQTADLVAASTSGFRTAMAGADLADAVMDNSPEPVLTHNTFIPSSAQVMAHNINMGVQKGTISSQAAGDVTTVTGYSSC